MFGSRKHNEAVRVHNLLETLRVVRNTVDILADRSDSAQPMHPNEMARQLRGVTEFLNLAMQQWGPTGSAAPVVIEQKLALRATAAVPASGRYKSGLR